VSLVKSNERPQRCKNTMKEGKQGRLGTRAVPLSRHSRNCDLNYSKFSHHCSSFLTKTSKLSSSDDSFKAFFFFQDKSRQPIYGSMQYKSMLFAQLFMEKDFRVSNKHPFFCLL